jgi:hypothetical protein
LRNGEKKAVFAGIFFKSRRQYTRCLQRHHFSITDAAPSVLQAGDPRSAQAPAYVAVISKAPALHGLQSRKAVSIIKEHQVTVLIFTGRDFSLGVTERAKQELCCYFRRRLEPTPSGVNCSIEKVSAPIKKVSSPTEKGSSPIEKVSSLIEKETQDFAGDSFWDDWDGGLPGEGRIAVSLRSPQR